MNQQKGRRVLFLNLTTFSKTGGIEKFNKCLLKALATLSNENIIYVESLSACDSNADEKYFPVEKYKGYSRHLLAFIIQSVLRAKKFDQIIFGHINLAIIGCLIKILFPKKRVILIVHGIEAWQALHTFKKYLLQKADLILTSSNFTKSKLVEVQKVNPAKISIFYNTIDPFFSLPANFEQNSKIRNYYGLKSDDYILFTLTRLSYLEQYKGYDTVIKCLPQLLQSIPNLKYVIGGKYDKEEKARIDEIIKKLHLEKAVIFTGYIKEDELIEHYQMADLFIMPSKAEGFGIVFIEAMVSGLPVIAGNIDGSVDALQNGELGTLVNPFSTEEISEKVLEHYHNYKTFGPADKYNLQQKALSYFGFDLFKNRLHSILSGSIHNSSSVSRGDKILLNN